MHQEQCKLCSLLSLIIQFKLNIIGNIVNLVIKATKFTTSFSRLIHDGWSLGVPHPAFHSTFHVELRRNTARSHHVCTLTKSRGKSIRKRALSQIKSASCLRVGADVAGLILNSSLVQLSCSICACL